MWPKVRPEEILVLPCTGEAWDTPFCLSTETSAQLILLMVRLHKILLLPYPGGARDSLLCLLTEISAWLMWPMVRPEETLIGPYIGEAWDSPLPLYRDHCMAHVANGQVKGNPGTSFYGGGSMGLSSASTEIVALLMWLMVRPEEILLLLCTRGA